ncbi:MAG: TatD family hydrolase [Clostridia bacterium]|nr:TatD family hydrolase [Clostridia bacterium]
MFVDTHCHLTDKKFREEEIAKILECPELEFCVILGCDAGDSKNVAELAKKHIKIYGAVGIHPENLEGINVDLALKDIERLADNEKIVAVGEVGLDYHFRQDNKELQKEVFIRQIDLANKLGKPICVHCRDAEEDMLEILRKNKEKLSHGFVMHCYSAGEKYVDAFAELGAYFGLAGNYTYKGYERGSVKYMPKEKILLETDSPYLAPGEYRGQKNNPTLVKVISKKLAENLNETFDEICSLTTQNAKRFYGIKK